MDDAEKRLRESAERVANTADGIVLLQYLHELCGFSQNQVVISRQTGEVNPLATMHDIGARSIYLQLRQILPYNKLAEIELPPIPQEEPEPNERNDFDELEPSGD